MRSVEVNVETAERFTLGVYIVVKTLHLETLHCCLT